MSDTVTQEAPAISQAQEGREYKGVIVSQQASESQKGEPQLVFGVRVNALLPEKGSGSYAAEPCAFAKEVSVYLTLSDSPERMKMVVRDLTEKLGFTKEGLGLSEDPDISDLFPPAGDEEAPRKGKGKTQALATEGGPKISLVGRECVVSLKGKYWNFRFLPRTFSPKPLDGGRWKEVKNSFSKGFLEAKRLIEKEKAEKAAQEDPVF